MIDLCYLDSPAFDPQLSKAIAAATTILSSRKDRVLKLFFRRNPDEPTSPVPKDEAESEERYSFYSEPPFISNLIETSEKTEVINNEEVKVQVFQADPKNTRHLDRLFSIVFKEPAEVNLTAFAHFNSIVKSFVDNQYFHADLLKYFFARSLLRSSLLDHVVHQPGHHLLNLLVNINKRSVEGSKASMSIFLLHRLELYQKIFDNLIGCESQAQEEFAEGLCDILSELLREHGSICDAEYFIEKVLLDSERLRQLLQKTAECAVGRSDQVPEIRAHLLSLLTTLVDYSTGKFEDKHHFDESPVNSRFNHRGEEDEAEDKKNIEIPLIMEAAEEHKTALSDALAAFLPRLADLLAAQPQVAAPD